MGTLAWISRETQSADTKAYCYGSGRVRLGWALIARAGPYASGLRDVGRSSNTHYLPYWY
jgi:hypothetical protein